MSHHLRHDRAAPATKSGWVHVDELAQILRASGHKVSSDQLLLIAGALGEPRFELDGDEIRAAYGHSIPAQIPYEARRAPQVLFHATPTRNLASVFEARAGLRPSGRNWVHLTESCQVAVDAARRQRSAVSVLEVDAPNVAGLVHATGATWLAPGVPVGSIRILPVRRVRDLTLDHSGGIHGASPSIAASVEALIGPGFVASGSGSPTETLGLFSNRAVTAVASVDRGYPHDPPAMMPGDGASNATGDTR